MMKVPLRIEEGPPESLSVMLSRVFDCVDKASRETLLAFWDEKRRNGELWDNRVILRDDVLPGGTYEMGRMICFERTIFTGNDDAYQGALIAHELAHVLDYARSSCEVRRRMYQGSPMMRFPMEAFATTMASKWGFALPGNIAPEKNYMLNAQHILEYPFDLLQCTEKDIENLHYIARTGDISFLSEAAFFGAAAV